MTAAVEQMTHRGLGYPDLQGVFSPASFKQGIVGLLADFPGMTCGVWQHRPESVGHVRARSADPFDDPMIQPNYLSDPSDQRVQVAGVKLARELMHTRGWCGSLIVTVIRPMSRTATIGGGVSCSNGVPRAII
jgi:choline dehydrogenase-like flavoprotein